MIIFLKLLILTDNHVRINCIKMSTQNTASPSARVTLLLVETLASEEPRAIVTMKSKAFILDNVLLPETLKRMTIDTYARNVNNIVVRTLSQLLNILSILVFFISGHT